MMKRHWCLFAALACQLAIASFAAAERKIETNFFNGKDLTGWKGNSGYWSVEGGAIVGHSDAKIPKNEFIWSDVPVGDFHLSVDVKLTPDNRNAGIQFRSKKANEQGQAHGYQADIGAGFWGKLYHEHGRKKLDWNNHADGAVKPGEWNRYEILAVGDRIWTAINGKLCVSLRDPQGERTGQISFQIHSGPPQTVAYRNPVLTHNPPVQLAGLDEAGLNAKLKTVTAPSKPTASSPAKAPERKKGETFPTDLPELPLPERVPRFEKGAFALSDDDVIAFLGGGGMVKQVQSGVLEGLLTVHSEAERLRFRDLSWQADTVYQRQRPRNYGSQASVLGRVGGTVVIAAFGQMETLEGTGRLPEFIQSYEALIEEFVPRTEKVVLITPYPAVVSDAPKHGPDLGEQVASVQAYGEAIGRLAAERGWVVVDMGSFDAKGLTLDGLQLTEAGQARWGEAVARQLLGKEPSSKPENWSAIQAAIHEKNDFWHRHRRPTNWAFVYGNRQTQPSSYDHRAPGERRWFPEEVRQFLPLVEAAEETIFELK